jgi:hypothetical protein
VVVEKKLAREQNLSRHDLGREAFVSKVRTGTRQPFGSGSALIWLSWFWNLFGNVVPDAMKLANANTFLH